MKEKIYTIPVNEAYEIDCECPLCYLQSKLESESVDYALGAAMMEPDYRIESNDKGFCNKHFSMMFQRPNKLSLSLVLDTHLDEVRKKISKYDKQAKKLKNSSGGLFKKSDTQVFNDDFTNTLKDIQDSCIICDKINYTIDRYIDVLLYMWENDSKFKKKFDNSKGVCIPHFESLCRASTKSLPKKSAGDFVSSLCEKQKQELERIQEDIHRFTLKFDYRNQDMEWGTAKDAPIRTIEKISGTIIKIEE